MTEWHSCCRGGQRTRTATARMQCRNLTVTGNVVAIDSCDPALADGVVQFTEIAEVRVEVTVPATPGAAIEGGWAEIIPARNDVQVLGGGVTLPTMAPGTTHSLRALVYLPPTADCWPEDTTLRFRVEVSGFDGFKDRGYFEVPLNCTVVGTQGLAPMPGEVPRADVPGVRQAMRLLRRLVPNGQSTTDLRME